jgi:hypothetical protein
MMPMPLSREWTEKNTQITSFESNWPVNPKRPRALNPMTNADIVTN